MDNLTNTLTSSLTTTGGDILDAIGAILPTILLVVGGVLVITVGIRFFKKFGKG